MVICAALAGLEEVVAFTENFYSTVLIILSVTA